MAKTPAGSPRVAGGSPADSPTSRWAIAIRVSESISSSTSWPWSRNHSAIRVATKAAAQPHQRRARRRWRRRRRCGPCPRGRGRPRGTPGPRGRARRPGDEHGDRAPRAAGDHRQQGRLADAGAGEDARAAGRGRRAPACPARGRRGSAAADPVPGKGFGRVVVDVDRATPVQRRAAVDRAAEPVEHPAEQVVAGAAPAGRAERRRTGSPTRRPRRCRAACRPASPRSTDDHLGQQARRRSRDQVADGGGQPLDAARRARRRRGPDRSRPVGRRGRRPASRARHGRSSSGSHRPSPGQGAGRRERRPSRRPARPRRRRCAASASATSSTRWPSCATAAPVPGVASRVDSSSRAARSCGFIRSRTGAPGTSGASARRRATPGPVGRRDRAELAADDRLGQLERGVHDQVGQLVDTGVVRRVQSCTAARTAASARAPGRLRAGGRRSCSQPATTRRRPAGPRPGDPRPSRRRTRRRGPRPGPRSASDGRGRSRAGLERRESVSRRTHRRLPAGARSRRTARACG